MNDAEPGTTFQNLPLTPEQDSEIRHYLHVRARNGMPWDTPELQAMIADMLDPPELPVDAEQRPDGSMDTERSSADADCCRERGVPLHGYPEH